MMPMRKAPPIFDDRFMQSGLHVLYFAEARLFNAILPAPVTTDLSAYAVNGTFVWQKHTAPNCSQALTDLQ